MSNLIRAIERRSLPYRAMGDRQIGEEPGHAGVENRHVFPAGLVPERAGEPAFAQTAGPGDEQIAAFGDPVAGGEFEE